MSQAPIHNGRKHLLIVTHNVAGEFKGGGIEVYQEQLKKISGYYASMLYPTLIDGKPHWRLVYRGARVIDQPLEHVKTGGRARNAEGARLFRELLQRFKVDIVHFQHLLGLPLLLPQVCREQDVPCVFTWHDHYLICQKYALLDYNARYCNTLEEPVSQCDFCLQITHKAAPGSQTKRRSSVATILQAFNAIVFNTAFSRDAMMSIYPDAPIDGTHIIEMMMPHGAPRGQVTTRNDTEELRVVIPGTFTTFKGAVPTIRLMAGMTHLPIRFTVLGPVHEDRIENLLKEVELPNTKFVGGYVPEDAIKLMSEHDVSLHLTIAPESYMIALSEAWSAGIVPIVTNLGAPGERVQHGKNGFVVSPYSLGRLHDILMDLHNDREKLRNMQNTARATKVMSAKEHLTQIKALYDSLTDNRAP